MNQLDPKAVWLFFFSFLGRGLVVAVFFIGFTISIFLNEAASGFYIDFLSFWTILWVFLILYVVIAYVWARLTYHFYRYEFTENGFRKELGVIWKKYVTIPYDRIQNIDIYRGVIARLLGLSDLHIQTAGASAQYSRYGAWGLAAEGRLPGLSPEVAEQLRDELVRQAKISKEQGL